MRREAPSSPPSRGFVLLSAALALAIVAALAYLMSYEAGVEVDSVAAERAAGEARLVAEAGLAHAVWTANNSACTGYALSSTSFGDHAYSATFTPTSGSPISVAGTGILDSGVTRTLTGEEVAVYGVPLSTTLQPDPAGGKDAWITSGNPDWNYGAHEDLRASTGAQRTVLEFDLSGIPATARLVSATLELYAETVSTAGDIAVHATTASWTEGTCSGAGCTADGITWDWRDGATPWAAPGVDHDSSAADITNVATASTWHAFDLIAPVADWLGGGLANNGVLVKAPDGANVTFKSSDDATATLRPKLTVVYACECGGGSPTTLTLQPDPAGDDAYTWDGAHDDKNFGVSTILKVNNASAEQFSLLRFDLSAIPAQATVTSATLDLYLEGGNDLSNGVLDIHRAAQPWLEGTQDDETTTGGVTYNEYALGNAWTAIGGDYDPTPVDTLTIPSLTPGWYQWDVIAAAADWISGVETNDGFFLRASGGSVDKISFTSGDGASAASWPRLTIDYNCPCGAACPADPLAPSTVILSTMSQATLGGLTFSDKDLAEYDKDADTATLYLDGSVVGVTQDIDALHVLANGHLVLSTIGTETLGGTTFDNEDLVDYDPIADIATVLFDGSAAFTAGSTDVSAVHVTANRHLVLSNEYAATLGGLSFEPNDLIDYDPVTDTATLLLDGDAVGLLGRIDAVHLLDDGHLVLSTNAPASLGGLSFTEGDLVEYDPVGDTASLFLDGALFTAAENVRSAHVGAGSGEITFSEPSLWLSTLDDVASSGAPGLDSWTGGEVIAIASPSFALEPGATDGTFSSILNLDDFAADSDADIDAIHYVGSDITVGSANSVALLSGDVLLSTVSDETLTSTNSLAVNDEDVFAFRPDVAGDYGAGTFIFLIDGSQIHGANTVGVSLVEENTTVGDGSLTKASFIMAITGRRDVIEFTADDVGAGTTTGSFTEFIDGAGLDLDSEIRGLDLAEEAVTVGGHAIPAGAILATLDNGSDDVGDNQLPTDSTDVFYFTVTQVGATPVADATLLFEGLDVGLDTTQEHVQAFSLAISTSSGFGPPPSACDGTFADDFETGDYTGSTGTLAWATSWVEINESNGASSGDEQVVNRGDRVVVRVRDNDGGGEGVGREADLSAYGDATLSFDYQRAGLDNTDDYATLDVWDGNGWVELARYQGPATDSAWQAESLDVGLYIRSDFRLRFLTSSGMGGSDIVFIDNVEICVSN